MDKIKRRLSFTNCVSNVILFLKFSKIVKRQKNVAKKITHKTHRLKIAFSGKNHTQKIGV